LSSSRASSGSASGTASPFHNRSAWSSVSRVPSMWVVWCASRISACSPTSCTQSAESCAASRKPRARSMRVIAWVMRLVIVNVGEKVMARLPPLQ